MYMIPKKIVGQEVKKSNCFTFIIILFYGQHKKRK